MTSSSPQSEDSTEKHNEHQSRASPCLNHNSLNPQTQCGLTNSGPIPALSLWIFSFSIFHQLLTAQTYSLIDSLSSHFWHGSWLQAALLIRKTQGALQEVDHCSQALSRLSASCFSVQVGVKMFFPDNRAITRSPEICDLNTDIYFMWGGQSVFKAHKSTHFPLLNEIWLVKLFPGCGTFYRAHMHPHMSLCLSLKHGQFLQWKSI